MAAESPIEWTEATWNPVTGCDKVSPGCKNCYAARMALRLRAMGQHNYRHGFQVTLQPQALSLPLTWKRGRKIFVNSMSDLFHESVPVDYIQQVFAVMNQAPQHTYQILTKRPQRLLELDPVLPWADHIWMGVSVESAAYRCRIDLLRRTHASVKFLSVEPLLGQIADMNLEEIDWVIVGGESGPGARLVQPEWVANIRDQCLAANVKFFFKQWGGVRKHQTGRELEGRTWDDMPKIPQTNLAFDQRFLPEIVTT